MFNYYSKGEERVSVSGEHKEGMLKIGVSRCSKRDHFIRAKGRGIAQARMRANPFLTLPMEDCSGEKFVEIAKGIAEQVEKDMTLITKSNEAKRK